MPGIFKYAVVCGSSSQLFVIPQNYIYHRNLVLVFLLYTNICLVAYKYLISKLRGTLL